MKSFTKVSGLKTKISDKEKDSKYGKTGQSTKDGGRIIKQMEEED